MGVLDEAMKVPYGPGRKNGAALMPYNWRHMSGSTERQQYKIPASVVGNTPEAILTADEAWVLFQQNMGHHLQRSLRAITPASKGGWGSRDKEAVATFINAITILLGGYRAPGKPDIRLDGTDHFPQDQLWAMYQQSFDAEAWVVGDPAALRAQAKATHGDQTGNALLGIASVTASLGNGIDGIIAKTESVIEKIPIVGGFTGPLVAGYLAPLSEMSGALHVMAGGMQAAGQVQQVVHGTVHATANAAKDILRHAPGGDLAADALDYGTAMFDAAENMVNAGVNAAGDIVSFGASIIGIG